MSYVNTENKAYQKLNSWQKGLVHFSQNALTRFIYQLILLADLIGLANVISGLFKIKSINTINYNSIVLPIELAYLLAMQFGWLFSWYAMVNHENRRQVYFKWIYNWLILAILLIATSIILYFSTISFNNKILYTSLCFFIGWFGYELLVFALHIKDQIEISTLIEITKGQLLSRISTTSSYYTLVKDDTYDKFYVRSCHPITVDNNINYLFSRITDCYNYNPCSLFYVLIIAISFGIILKLIVKPVFLILYCILALIVLVALFTISFKHLVNDDCIICADHKYSISTCSKQDLIAKDNRLFCFSDAHSLETDWSDVKYRNHNQCDTFFEKISHRSHLFFNGRSAHQIYTISLGIILFSYLVKLYLIIINPIINFIKLLAMHIGNLIAKIDFPAIGYSLGILIVAIFIICIAVFEYAYLRKQK